MSGVVNAVKKPFKQLMTNPLQHIFDPGNITGVFPDKEEPIPEPKETIGLTESERSTIASDEADRAKKKKKGSTQSVLTSPLGSTQSAKTAVTKLGG